MKNDKMTQKTTVSELVKLLIEAKGTNNKQLALKLGISRMAVGHFLDPKSNGKDKPIKNPYLSTIEKYFRALGEEMVVLNENTNVLDLSGSSLTIGQLQKQLGIFYFKTSIGTFEIDNKI